MRAHDPIADGSYNEAHGDGNLVAEANGSFEAQEPANDTDPE